MAATSATVPLTFGFLTVVREGTSYLGGYLVTNQWGRPLEFRLSTLVQPNRVQQILYGDTLEPYICGDLIGKTLVEKTGLPVQLVATDTEAALDLRNRVEMPVILVMPPDTIRGHARYPDDGPRIDETLAQVKGTLDLAEPFNRIREALGEARKMGVTSRG